MNQMRFGHRPGSDGVGVGGFSMGMDQRLGGGVGGGENAGQMNQASASRRGARPYPPPITARESSDGARIK